MKKPYLHYSILTILIICVSALFISCGSGPGDIDIGETASIALEYRSLCGSWGCCHLLRPRQFVSCYTQAESLFSPSYVGHQLVLRWPALLPLGLGRILGWAGVQVFATCRAREHFANNLAPDTSRIIRSLAPAVFFEFVRLRAKRVLAAASFNDATKRSRVGRGDQSTDSASIQS